MLDKIVVLSCRKQAYLIFTDREPIGISSDKDVTILLMWFLGSPNAHLIVDYQTVTGIELRRDCSDEATVKIMLKDVA